MSLIRLKEFALCFYHALIDTVDHDGVEHAGYLAFLGLLSFFPFLVFFVAIAGAIGESDIGLHLTNLLLHNNLIPEKVFAALTPRIEEIVSGPPQGLLTLAIVGAVWTASSAVEGLRTILNRAYRVHTPPAYIFRRLLSIGQFLLLTVILMIAMLVLILFPLGWEIIAPYFPGAYLWETYWSNLRFVFTGLLLLLVVSSTYYILPNIRQRWRLVLPGAIIVVIAWMVSGVAFAAYLGHFNQVNLIYGSLGGIIVSLLFLYIFGMILVYGAEFNYHISRMLGETVSAKE